MKCPFCKTELVSGKEKKFENLADHVSNPNAEDYPSRPTFVCPMSCEMSTDSFWDEQGGWYSGRLGVDYMKIFEWKKENGDSTAAIGSWDRWQDNKNEFSHKIYPYLFWTKGNNKFFTSYKIAGFLFRFSEPKFFQNR